MSSHRETAAGFTLRFTLRGRRRPREVIIPSLGELEEKAMRVAWALGEVSVHDVREALGDGRAYTTVMTTMDRLFRKGLLSRRKSSYAYLYRPLVSSEELERGIVLDVTDGLLKFGRGSRLWLIARAIETACVEDGPLLEEVERLARQKRLEFVRARAAGQS